uniref:Zinc finger C4H2-type containing n=1 Tax=Homo sapiens TaxID=9606 RepID=A0A8V8TQM8_HUMAN
MADEQEIMCKLESIKEIRISLRHPSWSSAVPSWLTEALNSWAPEVIPLQLPQ